MKSSPETGLHGRASLRLRTRLTISHLVVGLTGVLLILVFTGVAMLQAVQQAAEDQLVSLATTSSQALTIPLQNFLTTDTSIEDLRSTAAHLWAGTSNIHYTVFLEDGTPILDSHAGAGLTAAGEVPPEVLQTLQSQVNPTVLSRPNEHGTTSLMIAAPVTIEGHIIGVVRLETPLETILPTAWRYLIGLMLFSLLLIVGVSAVAVLLSRYHSAPIERMAASAGRLISGSLNTRALVEGQQETQIIANALNTQTLRLMNSINELRTFVASASHELRTPITTIKLRAEALRAGALKDPAVSDRFLTEIEDEIDRLSRMVNDLLDLSRIEAETDTSHYRRLNLGNITAEVGDIFNARADEAGIQIELEIEPDLPVVLGDEEQLWRVIMNLMDNALNFTPPGGCISLSVASVRTSTVRIEVQDSGPGIPSEDLPHLFQRFFRTDITRQRSSRSKGSGLGLAMCKSIVENHHGKIGVESQLGEGTIFWVELPALQ